MSKKLSVLVAALVLALVGAVLCFRPAQEVATPPRTMTAPEPREQAATAAPLPTSQSEAQHAPPSQHSPRPIPAPVTESAVLITRRSGFIEDDGLLSYRGKDYIVTSDPSGIRAELTQTSAPGSGPIVSMALESVTVGGKTLDLGAERSSTRDSSNATLSFKRGSLTERYQFRENEFEQDFVISELPVGRGAITVTQRIESTVPPPADGSTGASLQFGTEESGAFRISRAVAIDADGRKLPLELAYAANRLQMTIPGPWVESARLPIVIDPVVGSAFTVSSLVQNYGDSRCQIAYGSGPNEWMVAWWDQVSTGNQRIYAQRISATGALLGSPITVNSLLGYNQYVSITYSPGLNQYMIAWFQYISATNTNRIAARAVAANGTLPGSEFLLLSSFPANVTPGRIALSCNAASTFIAVVSTTSAIGTGYIWGYLFSNTGTISAQPTIQPVLNTKAYPRVAYSNSEFLATWTEGTSLMARGLSTTGAFLTPVTTVATSTTGFWDELSAGNNQFLVTWTNNPGTSAAWGRVVQANSASTLAFATAAFTISTGAYAPHGCYSSTAGQWFVAHGIASGIAANLVTPTGSSGADQTVLSTQAGNARTAWNSATNEVLVAYDDFTSALTLKAIRFGLGSTSPPPGAPTNLSATASDQVVALSWSPVTGATSYKLFTASSPGGYSATPLAVVNAPNSSFTHSSLTNGTYYYYIVVASNSSGDSPSSNEVFGLPLPPPPSSPASLSAIGGNTSITLTWPGVPGASGYAVYRSSVSGGPYKDFDIPLWIPDTSFVDIDLENGRTYYYVVKAFGMGGAGLPSPQASAIPSGQTSPTALLVVGNVTLSPADTLIRDRLDALGFIVVIRPDTLSATEATGKSLVFISSTVTSTNVNTKFRDSPIPVMVCENAVMDDMKMTGTVSGTDYGTTASQSGITISDTAHPMAAGYAGSPSIVSTAQTFAWGVPNLSASKVATLTTNSARAAVYGYTQGSTMFGTPPLVAPSRRTGFFLESLTAASLNAVGWALFDAAVRWTHSSPASPGSPGSPLVVPTSSNSARISWDPVANASTYNVLVSASPNGPYTRIAVGVSTLDYYAAGLPTGTSYFRIEAVTSLGGISFSTVQTAATPQASDVLVVGITGPRYIRAWRPQQTQASFWNAGTYQAKIFRRTPAGVFTEITTGINGTWALSSLNTGTQANVGFSQASNPNNTQCTITAQTAEPNIYDQSTWELSYVASAGGLTVEAPVSVQVVVGSRRSIDTIFFFPKSHTGNGHTTRPFPTGSGNNFFAPDTTTRLQARNDFITSFATQATQYTRYAGIDLYWTIDPDSPILPGFTNNGNYVARDTAGFATQDFQGLMNSGAPNYNLKIYFVHGITSVGQTSIDALGLTHGPPPQPSVSDPARRIYQGRIILIGDDAQPETLAHEIIHAMGHPDHITVWNDLSGKLNNLKDIMANSSIMTPNETVANNPLNWNLMRPLPLGRRPPPDGTLLTDRQAVRAYGNMLSYPFFRLTD